MSSEPQTAGNMPLPGGDFILFITRLNIQGLFSLGIIENPTTGEASINLAQAKMLVADLEMLQAKTAGNLDENEKAQLDKFTRDLRHALDARS